MNDIQRIILKIFKEVSCICKRNNLTYYAIGGTCIGAVRHKGFIPWDDDLDIAVPIEQWDLFWECMKKELPSQYKIYDCRNVVHYRYVFRKIHDTTTSFIEEAEKEYPDAYKGIYIDVMPIAGIPEDERKRKNYYRVLRNLGKCNFIRRYPFCEMSNEKRKIIWFLLHLLSPIIPYHFFSDQWILFLKKYPLNNAQYTGYTWWDQVSDRLLFPISFFKTAIDLTFEDTSISCPVDWDGYLRKQFGDYMVLPPEEQRLDHHQLYVSVEQSYLMYKGDQL